MFLNVLETKCLENAVILGVYWCKELNKFAHLTTSGKKRHDPNSCRTNARQPSASCDAHFACRSGPEAQTANGCVRHKLSFGRIFARIVCDGFVSSFNALISFLRDWIYIMARGYRDCMFRNEWLKDAKFKSLVGSD